MNKKVRKKSRGKGKMSLGEHFLELRKRLMISAIAVAVGLVGGWFLTPAVWDVLREPVYAIAEQQGRETSINYGDVMSGFDLQVQIALFLAILMASPIWLYQIWAFFAPGLTKREKIYAVGFLGTAVPLFLLGVYVGWLIFPNIVRLLISFAPTEDSALLTARPYLDMVIKLMLGVGIGFVIPVFIVLLNFVGALSAKAIIKGWRVAILGIILFAGITTPATDLISMFLLAGAMTVLYFIAAIIAYIHDRRANKKMAAELAEYGIDPSDIEANS